MSSSASARAGSSPWDADSASPSTTPSTTPRGPSGLLSVLEHPREPADRTGARPVLRRLNGDETAGGTAWLHPARDQRQSEVFPIPMAVEHSGVSSCEIYWLD